MSHVALFVPTTGSLARRGTGATGRTLLLLGSLACLFDAVTTWSALRLGEGFYEHTPATAALIARFGLEAGLAVSVLARVAAIAVVAVAIERLPKLKTPLFGIGLVAVALTWLLVLANIAALAQAA